MKRLTLLAAAMACSIATLSASAQERGYRRHDAGPVAKHYRDGGRRDGYRAHRPDYPRYHSHGFAPYRPSRFHYPYWYYPAPAYLVPYPAYGPVPQVVERVYEAPRYYQERSYAQAEPARPGPRTPAAPAPARLERYTLSARELFEFDKATLRKPQPKLDEVAEAMKRDPRIVDVTITGHTDRLGTEAYNLELSMRRANAVKDYLVGKGIAANRLKAVGKGEAHPVVECKDAPRVELIKCLEPNRRVEVESITVERRVP